MDWLGIVGGLLGAASGGGLLGIVGGLIRQFLGHKETQAQASFDLDAMKEKHRHEETMRDKDKELLQLEGENRVKVAQAEGDAAVDAARFGAMGQSYASDKATFATGEQAKNSKMFMWVDAMRGGIRPVLTVILDMAVFIMFVVLMVLLWNDLSLLFKAKDPEVMKPMMGLIVEIAKSILFMANMATGYWFVAKTPSSARA